MEDSRITKIIEEIRIAIDSKEVERARELLREALKQPTAEIYYYAALVAIDEEQKIRLLDRAIDLDPFYQPATLILSALKASKPNTLPAKKEYIVHSSPELSTDVALTDTGVSKKPKKESQQQWLVIGTFAFLVIIFFVIIGVNNTHSSPSYETPPPTSTPEPTSTPILPLETMFVEASRDRETYSSLTFDKDRQYCIFVEGAYKFGSDEWQYRDAFFEETSEGAWVKQVNLSVDSSRHYLQSLPLAIDPLHSYLFSYAGKGKTVSFKLYDQYNWVIDDTGGVNIKIYNQACNELVR